ncbi:hypothetical protein [Paenibacillus qinlingensis]|uniref:hypothetical protein n=1 Tax=Paenibacillus qinlingensis TaxID=1837343 RepID=UPI001563A4E7|nr:hypothetical protein [Paenibacillus qinlingensis]NQX60053.1 hypothetical protein [Paenibacillus qinlingensis]
MIVVAGILIVVTMIIVIDAVPLWKRKMNRELVLFFFLLLVGTGLNLAQTLHMEIPNPVDWIKAFYLPASDFLMRLFK